MTKIGINIKDGKVEKDQSSLVVGIDLGTTNSLIAYVNDGQSTIIKEKDGRHTLVPSILRFNENHEVIIGHEARPYLVEDPENTIFSVKRLMGKSYNDVEEMSRRTHYQIIEDDTEKLVRVRIHNRNYTPIELSAAILKRLKNLAETTLNRSIERAVITVPAYFNDTQRQATRDAGKIAGLDVLRIVNEPTAAALAYGAGTGTSQEETIAVYDLGGGTFDISILQITHGIFEVMCTHGDTYLGGDDIDMAIIDHWSKTLGITKSHPEIRWLAEEAKKSVSNGETFEATLDKTQLILDPHTLEALSQPFIQKTLQSCKQALKDADLTPDEIDKVILVGGSTRSPYVKKAVESFFGQKPFDHLNPDETVALGAAIQADILAGNRKDLLLLDITPLSLGIETVGGLMDVVIPRNTSIPFKAQREYTTSVDGQTRLKVSVFQGERDLVLDNRKLGEFVLGGIPPMAAGLPKIQITFVIDANGILQVRAQEMRSQVEQQIEIKSQFGLDEKQMAQMLKESIQFAEEDMQARGLREAQVEARQLLRSMDTFCIQNPKLVAPHLDQIKELSQALDQQIDHGGKDDIMTALDALNTYTRPLAEKAMDYTISQSMKGKKV